MDVRICVVFLLLNLTAGRQVSRYPFLKLYTKTFQAIKMDVGLSMPDVRLSMSKPHCTFKTIQPLTLSKQYRSANWRPSGSKGFSGWIANR